MIFVDLYFYQLKRRVKGYLTTPFQIDTHLIECNPGLF